MLHMESADVSHLICTRLRPGHSRLRVGVVAVGVGGSHDSGGGEAGGGGGGGGPEVADCGHIHKESRRLMVQPIKQSSNKCHFNSFKLNS